MLKHTAALFAVITLNFALSARTSCAETPELVELFPAAEAGQLEVDLIPKNSNQATILIRNKTDQPLTVKLPEAFVGVMAQIGGIGGGGGIQGGGIGGGGGGVQAVGGGGGIGGGIGGGGLGGGGGVFNVAPDSVRRVKIATVCLEHGKDDPKAKMDYVLQPIESFTSDARVIEICKLLGTGTIDTAAAQAAVWHVAAGLSWQELAQKVKTQHLNGSVDLYFTPAQIQQAARIVQAISRNNGPQPSGPQSSY